jgi:hypothetical protein
LNFLDKKTARLLTIFLSESAPVAIQAKIFLYSAVRFIFIEMVEKKPVKKRKRSPKKPVKKAS